MPRRFLAGVDAVFERALAKEPGARPASAGELVEELGDVFRDAEPVTAVLPRPHPTATPPARRPRLRWLAPLAFVVLLLGGLTAAAFVSNGDEPEVRTITRVTTTVSTVSDTESTLTVTETATVPEDETSVPSSGSSGSELNNEGFARMQAEDYEGALPLLEQAVSQLAGSGTLAEAYASYNLAFTRLALGSCDGVLELLDRSEEVQGERSEIDRLRREAEKQCGDGPGKGNGKNDEQDD